MGAVVGILVLGCGSGGSGSAGNTVSCSTSYTSGDGSTVPFSCQDIAGATAAQISSGMRDCTTSALGDAGAAYTAAFSNAPCSHQGALGGCRSMTGTITVTNWAYQTGETLTLFQSVCTSSGGTFVAP